MAERQIAFAAARYTDKNGFVQSGMRGEVHDIPDAEIERLEALGALVAPNAELHKPGILMPLDEGASDEKIRNYMVSGNTNEILTQAAKYPTSLVEKLVLAEEAGLNRGDLLLGLGQRVTPLVATPVPEATVITDPSKPTGVAGEGVDAPVDPGFVPVPGTPAPGEYADTATLVAEANVPTILAQVANDKALAQEVLDIENAKEKPRVSLTGPLTALIES